ncbi:branched-chain amino acid ABC transporter permease [Methylobacterium nonmethylotrophicum]|uniref:Branched-chain amino acid ABC transporter permease n=1 Tax=Methylobacterium nonmethylotrophicum TaxID=1141884 RepID=A0A4Z0NUD0_9HYPH|nr:branched-chain amino acid ABC transporter permease [Methylobacterium nonmethylotrophicum]TGE01105.1 branched-chain amino acid ABC transporter permease [Methylobacterium nonmethylotrophicum]
MSARLSTLALAVLLAAPFLLGLVLPQAQAQFWTVNILGRALVYGVVALSLTFLATYGGFVSLAQMTVAGIAGYGVAILVEGAVPGIVGGLPYALAVPAGILAATLAGLVIGAVAVRTRDIYLLMITLALAMAVSRFAESNIAWFNGYEGIRNVVGPSLFGVPFRQPQLFYYASLAVAALLYAGVLYLVRTPFGLVLQAIRDNPRRAAALGYDVALHRIAAFGVAGFIAGCGGVLTTIYNIGISPGSIGLGASVNILIISVIGGLGHPAGAFVGSLIFAVFDTFAASLYDRDRFNTLIGLVFLGIVLVSPDGIVGLVRRIPGLRRLPRPRPDAAPRTAGTG